MKKPYEVSYLCENCDLEIHPNVPCEEVGGVDKRKKTKMKKNKTKKVTKVPSLVETRKLVRKMLGVPHKLTDKQTIANMMAYYIHDLLDSFSYGYSFNFKKAEKEFLKMMKELK